MAPLFRSLLQTLASVAALCLWVALPSLAACNDLTPSAIISGDIVRPPRILTKNERVPNWQDELDPLDDDSPYASLPAKTWRWADQLVRHDRTIGVTAVTNMSQRLGRLRAFNGGLEHFDGTTYVCMRIDSTGYYPGYHPCKHVRSLYLSALDDAGELAGTLQKLPLPGGTPCNATDDARLIACAGSLFAVYNAEVGPARHQLGSRRLLDERDKPPTRIFLAELDVRDPTAYKVAWARELEGPIVPGRFEKNWTPFCHDDQLHFIQRTNAPTVFALPATELARSQNEGGYAQPLGDRLHLEDAAAGLLAPAIEPNWRGGPWRGGTPALYEPALGEYVSFFHSYVSPSPLRRFYYAGAYTFAAEPPFEIRRYTPHPIALPAVTQRWHSISRVVFPMGLLDGPERYLLSYGQDDAAVALAYIDKASLFAAMVPATAAEVEVEAEAVARRANTLSP